MAYRTLSLVLATGIDPAGADTAVAGGGPESSSKSLSAQLPSENRTSLSTQSDRCCVDTVKLIGLSFFSSRFVHCIDTGDDEDQLVGSTSTVMEVCCGTNTLELVDRHSEPLFGMVTARLGFCDFVKETAGEKMVGGKGETIVL